MRAFFRYTERQKKILYDISNSERDKNKKATTEQAEQAVQVIRDQLPVEEFVKVKQVKALNSQGGLDLTRQEMTVNLWRTQMKVSETGTRGYKKQHLFFRILGFQPCKIKIEHHFLLKQTFY